MLHERRNKRRYVGKEVKFAVKYIINKKEFKIYKDLQKNGGVIKPGVGRFHPCTAELNRNEFESIRAEMAVLRNHKFRERSMLKENISWRFAIDREDVMKILNPTETISQHKKNLQSLPSSSIKTLPIWEITVLQTNRKVC